MQGNSHYQMTWPTFENNSVFADGMNYHSESTILNHIYAIVWKENTKYVACISNPKRNQSVRIGKTPVKLDITEAL